MECHWPMAQVEQDNTFGLLLLLHWSHLQTLTKALYLIALMSNTIGSFIGNDYFCDTGNPGPSTNSTVYYTDDPLWDGKGCGPTSSCCQLYNPPWFYKELPQTTSNNIEVWQCFHSTSADVIIQMMEIYVK